MPALELSQVDKRFGAVHAVSRASLRVEAGRVHAVVGENGAGKSTLLKMAAGLVRPDEGVVRIDGRVLTPHTPMGAIRSGVGMVQQHFALVGVFTALENVVLGAEPTRGLGVLDLEAARARVMTIASELGATLPLDVPASELGVGDRQRLEIVRALYRDARILILDEPTAVLTPGEAEALYATLRRLADAGRAVVVVTHKLDEVRMHADAVTVLRRGAVILDETRARGADDMDRITAAIMGAGAHPAPVRQARPLGPEVIALRDVRLGRALHGVSLTVRAGETVGIAGVEGNGQRELVRVLAGLCAHDAGDVAPAPDAVATVLEDRQTDGLLLDATVRDNALLGELGRFTRHGLLDTTAMDAAARSRIARAQGAMDLDVLARALSGGNQQKIVVARAVARVSGEGAARALVLAHPTRGVDIGAARAIHGEIVAAASRGVAVLVVSADLDELRTLCDRILVLARGRVVADLPSTATDDVIGRAMLGTHAPQEAP